MIKVSVYHLEASVPKTWEAKWPQDLINEFKQEHMGLHGGFYFEEGSERESEFLAKAWSLKLIKKTYINVLKKDIIKFPFYYLSVAMDRDYKKNDFMDYSMACKGDGKIRCRMGAKQRDKIIIDSNKTKHLDIMLVPLFLVNNPKIYIISKRLKLLMEEAKFTGYKIIPCLEKDQDYSNQELSLEYADEKLLNEATFFQLIITEKTKNPPKIGKAKILYQCTQCGAVIGTKNEQEPYFFLDDLKEIDLQNSDEYLSENLGLLKLTGDRPIISSKFLKILMDGKMKGWRTNISIPKIPYLIVRIR